jgi:hypothetical protein
MPTFEECLDNHLDRIMRLLKTSIYKTIQFVKGVIEPIKTSTVCCVTAHYTMMKIVVGIPYI